nr:transcription elongation factor GreA-like [Nerophis lumbriciformis]
MEKTEALNDDDVRAQKVSGMDELKELAAKDPVELVVRILQNHDGKIMLDALDAEICGSVVEEKGYKRWWEKTKKMLRESRRASVPTKRSDPLILRDESASPGEHIVGEFEEARNPKAKVKALEAIQREAPLVANNKSLITRAYDAIHESARQILKMSPAQALELVALRDDIAEETNTTEQIADNALRLSDVLQILKVFDQISSRGVTEIAKLMQEKDQMKPFLEHIKVGVSRHALGPDALAWICRERKKSAEPVFGREVGSVILSVLELDTMDDGPRRAGRLANLLAEDKELIADLLDGVDLNEVRLFARKLLASPAFPELDRKSLMARVIKKYPETQDMVSGEASGKADEGLIVSYASLEKRKAEYEDLVNTASRKTLKKLPWPEITSVLNRRKIELQKDLERARATDFEGADSSSVNLGTKITLRDQNGKVQVQSMMGAWDGDPDNKILSYLSDMGQALIGKNVGDTAEVRDPETEKDLTVTIEKIETL